MPNRSTPPSPLPPPSSFFPPSPPWPCSHHRTPPSLPKRKQGPCGQKDLLPSQVSGSFAQYMTAIRRTSTTGSSNIIWAVMIVHRQLRSPCNLDIQPPSTSFIPRLSSLSPHLVPLLPLFSLFALSPLCSWRSASPSRRFLVVRG